MKKIISIICLFVVLRVHAQNDGEQLAKTMMGIWKDSASSPQKWTYDMGVVLKGVEGLWHATADPKYFNYMRQCMDLYVKSDGSIKTYKQEEYNIDNVLCGRILLTLYGVTNEEKYYKAAKLLREQLNTQPRTKEGGFWHKKRYPYQMWLDGLYMGEPFYAEWAATFHEPQDFNDIANQFIWMEKHARDNKTGLLYHGWDESKQEKWADKQTGLSANFWARAMGWYGMALVDVLEQFPEKSDKRDSLIAILNRYAVAIQKVQDGKSGLWFDVLNYPYRKGNYLETSASSMFVYALAKGVRLGYLSATSLTAAKKGYKGLVDNYIVKDSSGRTNLKGIVAVSGLGGTNPYRDGSYEYYISEPVVVNDPKGVGAFIMASNEIEMAKTTYLGKGKTILMDNYFNAETKKDITGTTINWHYKWDEQDNGGFSFFKDVYNAYGVTTNTLSAAPTKENLKNANIYLIVDADTKEENPNPNFVTPKDADEVYDWVKAGGVLLLLHNDKGNAEFEHFNLLGDKFGIHFNEDSRNHVDGKKFEMGALMIPTGDKIFSTARKVYLKEICTFKLSGNAKAVYTDKGDVLMAVAKIGKGTVFAVGDPWLYNEYVDGRKLPSDFDNYKALQDLVRWSIKQVPVQ